MTLPYFMDATLTASIKQIHAQKFVSRNVSVFNTYINNIKKMIRAL